MRLVVFARLHSANDWGKCLEIGAETRAVDISDIVFRDCHVIHATGSVLDVLNVDYAVIHDVLYENIDVEYDDVMEEPLIQKRDNEIYVNRNPEYTPNLLDCWITYIHEYSAVGKGRGITRDISFKNIRLTGKHGVNVRFEGYDEQHLCSNITVENIYWNGTKVEVLPKDCFTINQYCENIQWK